VDGTASGSCPVAGLDFSGVGSSGSTTRDLFDIGKISCEDGRWMGLGEDPVP
jgi:hypothetical protein